MRAESAVLIPGNIALQLFGHRREIAMRPADPG
jgi:hypothetical protein